MKDSVQVSTSNQKQSDQAYREQEKTLQELVKQHYQAEDYQQAIKYAEDGLIQLNNIQVKNSDDIQKTIGYLGIIGDSYSKLGSEAAIEYYEKAATIIWQKLDNYTNFHLSHLYKVTHYLFNCNRHEEAIQYYQRIEKILTEQLTTYKDIANFWLDMGTHAIEHGDSLAKNNQYHLVQEQINYYSITLNAFLKSISGGSIPYYIPTIYKNLAELYFGTPLVEYLYFFSDAFTEKANRNNVNSINTSHTLSRKLLALCYHIKKNPYEHCFQMLLEFLIPFMLAYKAAVLVSTFNPVDNSLVTFINKYPEKFDKEIDELIALIKSSQTLQQDIMNSPHFYVGVAKKLEIFEQKIVKFEASIKENNNNAEALTKKSGLLDRTSPINKSNKRLKGSQDITNADNAESSNNNHNGSVNKIM